MDQTGALIPGITVTVTDLNAGISRNLVGDDSGQRKGGALCYPTIKNGCW